MVYENNKIDSSVINMVANAYRQKLLNDVDSRKKEIRESSLSPEAKKKNYDNIDKMQTNRIKTSSILNAANIIGDITKVVANGEELAALENFLKKTGNEKAIATLKKEVTKNEQEIGKKYSEASKWISSVENPTFDMSPYHIEHLGEDGFNIAEQVSELDNVTPDAYQKLFRVALENETNPKQIDDKSQEKNAEDMLQKQDSQEILDLRGVEELFESDVLKEYVSGLEKSDAKRAKKFMKVQAKKQKAMKKVTNLQGPIDEIKRNHKDIQQALSELSSRSNCMPRDVFESIKADLDKQYGDLSKKLSKMEKKRDGIISKSRLEESIKSGKAYREAMAELANEDNGVRAENEASYIEDDLSKTSDLDERKKMEYRKEEMENIAQAKQRKTANLKNKIGGIVAFEVLNSTASADSKIALPEDRNDGEEMADKGNKMNHLLASAVKSSSEISEYDKSNEVETQIKSNEDIEIYQ